MKVLVVDDSRAIRTLITNVLKKNEHEVISAANGQEALDRLEENPDISVALVDWNMPIMDGLTFVQTVRSNVGYAKLYIMMITTEVEMSQVQRAIEAGANEYLMKPFGADELLARMQMLPGAESA